MLGGGTGSCLLYVFFSILQVLYVGEPDQYRGMFPLLCPPSCSYTTVSPLINRQVFCLMISFENSFILKVNSKALYSSVPGCPCSTTNATYNYTSPLHVKHYHFYAYIRNLTYNNLYHNIMKCAPKTIVS